MRLILVRHGQTPSNVRGLLDTAIPGPDLTELGHGQAAALPKALAEERIEAAFASTMTRAQQTLAPLAAAHGVEASVRDGIREIAAGDLEMRGDHVSVRRYLDTVIAWSAGELERRMPGGEYGHEVLARFDAVVEEASGHETAVLVSHGAAIRFWCGLRAENLSSDFIAVTPLSNTGAVVLEGSQSGRWTALSWTDAVLPSGREGEGPTGEAVPAGH